MYTRILVAIDSSETAKKALDEAIRLAKALNAELAIFHALDEGPLAQHALGIGTYIDADKVKAEMRKMAQSLLDTALASAKSGGIEATIQMSESEKRRTAELIADAARHWNADLVIVGTHGRHGVERLLVGSVAENLTRLATTSLLMVR